MCVYRNQSATTQFVRNGQTILGSKTGSPSIDFDCASSQMFQFLAKGDQVWVQSAWESYLNYDRTHRDISFAGVFIRM